MKYAAILVLATLMVLPAAAQVSVPINVNGCTAGWYFDHDGYGAPKWGGSGDYTASIVPGHTYTVAIPWATVGKFKLNDNGDGTYTFQQTAGTGGLIYHDGANPSIEWNNKPVSFATNGAVNKYSGDWCFNERTGDSTVSLPVANGYFFGFGRFGWGNTAYYNLNADGTVAVTKVEVGSAFTGNTRTATMDVTSLNLFSASGNTISFNPTTIRVKTFADKPSDFYWWKIDNTWDGDGWHDNSTYVKMLPGAFPLYGHLEHPSPSDPAVKVQYVTYENFVLTHAGQLATPQVTSFATGETKTWEFQWMIPGDANADAACDFSDYLVLEAGFGLAGGWEQGDFNLDGAVDFSDYLLLEANFGTTGSLVPEPMTLSLLGLGALALIRRRNS